MGFPRYSLWQERRKAPGGQRGPHGTPRSHTMSLRTPHSPSITHHAPASTAPTSVGAPHPGGFQCYGTEPGAVPVSPTPLQLHVHDVPYPGDCNQGAMPRVLVQGAVPGTPSQHRGATAQCCTQGTAPRYGTLVGCREVRASRRKPGSRREPAQPEGLGVC